MRQDTEEITSGFRIGIWEYTVGPNQHIMLLLVSDKPGITTPEIKDNPNVTSENGVYSLQQNGLIYSKQTTRRDGKFRGPTEWYLTKVGQSYLEGYNDLPLLQSWGQVQKYKHGKLDLPENPNLDIPLPDNLLGPATHCSSSSGEHSKLPTGKCLYCGRDVQSNEL